MSFKQKNENNLRRIHIERKTTTDHQTLGENAVKLKKLFLIHFVKRAAVIKPKQL